MIKLVTLMCFMYVVIFSNFICDSVLQGQTPDQWVPLAWKPFSFGSCLLSLELEASMTGWASASDDDGQKARCPGTHLQPGCCWAVRYGEREGSMWCWKVLSVQPLCAAKCRWFLPGSYLRSQHQWLWRPCGEQWPFPVLGRGWADDGGRARLSHECCGADGIHWWSDIPATPKHGTTTLHQESSFH